jgi:hypothetical protein
MPEVAEIAVRSLTRFSDAELEEAGVERATLEKVRAARGG